MSNELREVRACCIVMSLNENVLAVRKIFFLPCDDDSTGSSDGKEGSALWSTLVDFQLLVHGHSCFAKRCGATGRCALPPFSIMSRMVKLQQ
ncbi:unnamed protein product [Chondrus crispus]|uniref:Uncharacterized protein n=1 Tax=Chondrus crispus TaxID=2769 RepID=R7QFR6_CHOCR|nr:unnamed protein product [Chondrus crispus]CDF36296.1 unnamed protein product [Chondrus crispus]|eukprot:XP_005716115.1 unnamed protein product [Chondrus crispus]